MRRVVSDQVGNVALLFGLVTPLLLGGGGIGVDYSRRATAHLDLQQSTDAISQEITRAINICLEKQRTLQNGQLVNDLDPYCLNDPSFIGPILADAQAKLTADYTQRGYKTAPKIIGTPYYDRSAGVYRIAASVTAPCIFMQVLSSTACNIEITGAAGVTDAFAQANLLSINGPNPVEVWALVSGGTLPATYTAAGGWAPYTFMLGPSSVSGIQLSTGGVLSTTSTSGVPDTTCTAPCDPEAIGTVRIGVKDSGDPNQSGKNIQTAIKDVTVNLVHELKLRFLTLQDGNAMELVMPQIRFQVERSGGRGPYTYSAPNLPGNWVMNASTGEVTGDILGWTGPTSGTITAYVTDARGLTATATAPWTIPDIPEVIDERPPCLWDPTKPGGGSYGQFMTMFPPTAADPIYGSPACQNYYFGCLIYARNRRYANDPQDRPEERHQYFAQKQYSEYTSCTESAFARMASPAGIYSIFSDFVPYSSGTPIQSFGCYDSLKSRLRWADWNGFSCVNLLGCGMPDGKLATYKEGFFNAQGEFTVDKVETRRLLFISELAACNQSGDYAPCLAIQNAQ